MYLFNHKNLTKEEIFSIYKDKKDYSFINTHNLINSIQSDNTNNFEVFLQLYKIQPILFKNADIRSIYYAVAKKENFQYYTDLLYHYNIEPYINDDKKNHFIDSFYTDYPSFCKYLHLKGYPKIMGGVDAPSNYAILNCNFDLFNNIITEGYTIDYKYSIVSLIISRFPKNEKEIIGYINTLEYLLNNMSETDLKKEYKDKAYTKLFLFENIDLERIKTLNKKLEKYILKINFNIYGDDDNSTLKYLSCKPDFISYINKRHGQEHNFENYKEKIFDSMLKNNTVKSDEIKNTYDLLNIKISDDEASFLFHDFLNKPELIKFLIDNKFNFPLDYSIITRELIKNLTSSPEHFEHKYNYYSQSSLLKSLHEICLKDNFDPNFQYILEYFERDREKRNSTNILEIFINNDSNGEMLERLHNLKNFNYTENLFHTFSKYYKNNKLELYIDINYDNINKSGLKTEKSILIDIMKNIENDDELKSKINSLYQKGLINSSLNINDTENTKKRTKRI